MYHDSYEVIYPISVFEHVLYRVLKNKVNIGNVKVLLVEYIHST